MEHPCRFEFDDTTAICFLRYPRGVWLHLRKWSKWSGMYRNSQTWKLNRCSFLRCMTDLRWIPALSWRKRGQCQRLLQFIRRRMKSLSDLCPMMTSRYTLDFSLCTRQFESFDFQEKTWRRYLRTGQFFYCSGNVLLPNILVGSSEILAEYERLTNWL